MPEAADRWRAALAAWAIPHEILAGAPESPWGFPPALFAPAIGDPPDTPSRRRALDNLPDGGSVLDVGAGAGAASLALTPPARRIVAVDESSGMLDAFAGNAERAGVDHGAVLGRWPDVASSVEDADVVVCHHVVYNVADLDRFARLLTDHARRRVVVELTARHPQSALNPLWKHFWDLSRPDGPTADDAVAVLNELAITPTVDRWQRPPRTGAGTRADIVAFARRRLCLPADRDAEIDALLGAEPVLSFRDLVTLSWDGHGR